MFCHSLQFVCFKYMASGKRLRRASVLPPHSFLVVDYSALPYDKSCPEKVIAAVYSAAQTPDDVRQFVDFAHVELGISVYTLEAAVNVLIWSQRAIAANDFHTLSLERVIYSLSVGHCIACTSYRKTKRGLPLPERCGPHFCKAEKMLVRRVSSQVMFTLEDHRSKYGTANLGVPSTIPKMDDVFWSLLAPLCAHLAAGMDRIQALTEHHSMYPEGCDARNTNTIDYMTTVYKLGEWRDKTLFSSLTKCCNLTDPALHTRDQYCELIDLIEVDLPKETIQKELDFIVNSMSPDEESRRSIKRIWTNLRDQWFGKLIQSSFKRVSINKPNPVVQLLKTNISNILDAIFTPNMLDYQQIMHNRTVLGKPMMFVTPWHYEHKWRSSAPPLIWDKERIHLLPKLRGMVYYDDIFRRSGESPVEVEQACQKWFKVASTLTTFPLLHPPVLNVTGTNILHKYRDSGKYWEFQCELYNRSLDTTFLVTLPLTMVTLMNKAKLVDFCHGQAMRDAPTASQYSCELHRERLFGSQDEDSSEDEKREPQFVMEEVEFC